MSFEKSYSKSFAGSAGRKLGKKSGRGRSPSERKARLRAAHLGGARSSELFPSYSPSVQVEDAIRGLRNNETRVTSEVKGLAGKISMSTKVSYPAELLAAFRGLFGSTREYDFQMHQVLSVASSSGGGTLGFVAISPSVASYGEWTALAALFDEVKGISTSISWCTLYQPAAFATVTDMVLALDEQNLSTDPASYLSVFRLAGVKTFVSQLGDGGSGRHMQTHRFASRAWCATPVPYSTSPMGGLIGCWVYGNAGLFATSVSIATISSITRARFRCRA